MKSLDKTYIERSLSGYSYYIETCDKVTSTNAVLKERAKLGEKHHSVLIAGFQSSGRGRMGRTFFSPDDSGLYMSVLLRTEKINPISVTTDAAVCVAKAIEKLCGEKTGIKWVNDIYLKGKKVAGILAESSIGENGFVVLGIGVNVLSPENGFPDDIKMRAGSVFCENAPFLREKLAVEILKELSCEKDEKMMLYEYKSRDIVSKKSIDIIKNGTVERAVALSINDDYSLKVKKENGSIEDISSGDVSIRI